MDTLLDYVKWMGKYDFAACPLREADVLVLCVVSYFDLAPVFSDGRSAAHLRECLEAAEKGEIKLQITGGDLGNRELFLAAVRSHRFGDLIVSDYTDILEKEQAVQFSAMTFHDSRNFHFIAYRGTDSSLAGWKENFMISFTRTRAQELAAQYAARLLEALPEDLRPDFEPFFFRRDEDEALWRIVKAADKLSALIKCVSERKAGNGEFATAEASTRAAIDALDCPEARVFIEEFLPAYEMTLDQL